MGGRGAGGGGKGKGGGGGGGGGAITSGMSSVDTAKVKDLQAKIDAAAEKGNSYASQLATASSTYRRGINASANRAFGVMAKHQRALNQILTKYKKPKVQVWTSW